MAGVVTCLAHVIVSKKERKRSRCVCCLSAEFVSFSFLLRSTDPYLVVEHIFITLQAPNLKYAQAQSCRRRHGATSENLSIMTERVVLIGPAESLGK